MPLYTRKRRPLGGEYYVFRDSIHNVIEIDDEVDGRLLRHMLDTKEMQRLRFIRQNGLAFLVYPSLETTRFPHILGSFHVGKKLIYSLKSRQPSTEEGMPASLRLDKQTCRAFCFASALHDIGHGPLSHIWEALLLDLGYTDRDNHEVWGQRIITSHETEIGNLIAALYRDQDQKPMIDELKAIMSGTHPLSYINSLLPGKLDIDRLDFMARDTQNAGVTYGTHDLEWLIRSLRFARLSATETTSLSHWVVAIDGRKGLNALVEFVRARENMYDLVYHHKTVRAATALLFAIFRRAKSALRCGVPLPIHSSTMKDYLTKGMCGSTVAYASIDDSDIWTAVKTWAKQEKLDPLLASLSGKFSKRELFKAIPLSEAAFNI